MTEILYEMMEICNDIKGHLECDPLPEIFGAGLPAADKIVSDIHLLGRAALKLPESGRSNPFGEVSFLRSLGCALQQANYSVALSFCMHDFSKFREICKKVIESEGM